MEVDTIRPERQDFCALRLADSTPSERVGAGSAPKISSIRLGVYRRVPKKSTLRYGVLGNFCIALDLAWKNKKAARSFHHGRADFPSLDRTWRIAPLIIMSLICEAKCSPECPGRISVGYGRVRLWYVSQIRFDS